MNDRLRELRRAGSAGGGGGGPAHDIEMGRVDAGGGGGGGQPQFMNEFFTDVEAVKVGFCQSVVVLGCGCIERYQLGLVRVRFSIGTPSPSPLSPICLSLTHAHT